MRSGGGGRPGSSRCLGSSALTWIRRGSGWGGGALFSFQYTASGPADNVGFLTSDLAVCVSETLRGVSGGGGGGGIIATGAFLKIHTPLLLVLVSFVVVFRIHLQNGAVLSVSLGSMDVSQCSTGAGNER